MKATAFPTKYNGDIDLLRFSGNLGTKIRQENLSVNFDDTEWVDAGNGDSEVYFYLDGSIVTSFYLPSVLERRFEVECNRTVE